jgi:uncharacterized membrane protein
MSRLVLPVLLASVALNVVLAVSLSDASQRESAAIEDTKRANAAIEDIGHYSAAAIRRVADNCTVALSSIGRR